MKKWLKKMKVKRVVLDNYKSFQEPTEFLFESNDEGKDKNLILIGGMNGSGKTSLMEAVEICLYGIPKSEIFKRINKNGLRNRNANLSLEVQLELDSGEILTVKRKWRANQFLNEIKYGDLEEEMLVIQDGSVRKLSQELWQDYLNSIIPKSITKFFFFDGEKIQEIATEEFSGLRLKNDMESVLGIEIIRVLIDDLKRVRNKLAKNGSNVSKIDVEKRESDLKYIGEKLKERESNKIEFEKDRINYENDISEFEEKIKKVLGFDPDLLEKKNHLMSKKVELNLRLTKVKDEINKICSEILPYILLCDFFSPLVDQIKKEKSLRRNKVLIENADEAAQQIVEKILIPLLQESKNINLNSIKGQIIAILKKEGSTFVEPILSLTEDEEDKLQLLISKIEGEYKSGLEPLLENQEKLNKELSIVIKQRDELEIPGEVKEAYEELNKKKNELNQILGKTRQQFIDTEEEIFRLTEQEERQGKELDTLIASFEGTENQAQRFQRYGQLITAIEEYTEILKKSKLEDLEKYIFDMYKRLSSKRDLLDSISIDKDTYEITIWDNHKERINKRQMAAGEKEVFAISLLWGLAQSTELRLPVIIDTPLARLDSSHREQIVKQYFPFAGDQVILLSTDEEIGPNGKYYKLLEPHIEKQMTIRFDKNLECSTVEEDYFK